MRSRYPAGVPCWIDTAQPDVDAALAFYGGLFGWELADAMPAGAPGRYCMARLRGCDVAAISSASSADEPAAWTTYVSVDSADDAAARVTRAGGRVLTPPFDILDSGRMAVCADPGGAVFAVWQPNHHHGAQLVNEPNTWNWSHLNTRDMAGAEAFYGAVFGWRATPVDFGIGDARMLRSPGYGDFLEELDPGVRQRHRDAGAPEGFTDAVAWLQPMSSDQFPEATPAHWSVTFSIDDADAAAARARRLGGTVMVPPFDVPFSRMAVIRDPQGAVFTVSKYIPPE
jgi:uncharacterized protein